MGCSIAPAIAPFVASVDDTRPCRLGGQWLREAFGSALPVVAIVDLIGSYLGLFAGVHLESRIEQGTLDPEQPHFLAVSTDWLVLGCGHTLTAWAATCAERLVITLRAVDSIQGLDFRMQGNPGQLFGLAELGEDDDARRVIEVTGRRQHRFVLQLSQTPLSASLQMLSEEAERVQDEWTGAVWPGPSMDQLGFDPQVATWQRRGYRVDSSGQIEQIEFELRRKTIWLPWSHQPLDRPKLESLGVQRRLTTNGEMLYVLADDALLAVDLESKQVMDTWRIKGARSMALSTDGVMWLGNTSLWKLR